MINGEGKEKVFQNNLEERKHMKKRKRKKKVGCIDMLFRDKYITIQHVYRL